MKLFNYILLIIVSVCFVACNNDEADSINQDFVLQSNLEYGDAVKKGEELKVGIVVDSIDTNFDGSFITSVNTNNPNKCTVTFNNKSLLSTDRLDHNYKSSKTLWLQFAAQEEGEYIITVTVSNGVVAPKEVKINISVSEYVYNITLTCNQTEGSVVGGGEYKKGKQLTVEAIPKDGYDFIGLYFEGSLLTTNNPFTFTVSEDKKLEARFEKSKFKLEAEIIGEGTISGQNEYPKGAEGTLTAKANDKWRFLGWYTLNDALLSTDLVYTVSNISSNVKVRAKFVENVYVSFIIRSTGYCNYSDCDRADRKVATQSLQLTVQSVVYKNNAPIGASFKSKPLTITCDWGMNMLIWSVSKGKISYYCTADYGSGQVQHQKERKLSLYNDSSVNDEIWKSPRPDLGGFTTIDYFSNISLSLQQIDDRQIYVSNVINYYLDGKLSTFVIANSTEKSTSQVNFSSEQIPYIKSGESIDL